MAANSKIEWTEATWNPIAGCSIVSPGCHFCYAMRTAARLEAMGQAKYAGTTKKTNGKTLWTGKVNLDEAALSIPLRTRKPTVWFVNSMSDLFHESVPDEFIAAVFGVMAACPQHTFQVLTKWAERLPQWQSWIEHDAATSGLTKLGRCLWHEAAISGTNCPRVTQDIFDRLGRDEWPLSNVWLGVSTEDQQRADERIPWLLKTPAAVRFLSCEPLLGPIDIGSIYNGEDQDALCFIDWVIVGGESGHGARPMHPDWARSIRDQCVEAGVPFFFKQWGEWEPWYAYPPGPNRDRYETIPYWPDGTIGAGNCNDNGGEGRDMLRVGKKAAGRLLDGREWSEFPKAAELSRA